jgi:uncharacterized membrane protein
MFITLYFLALCLFFTMDMVWLGFIAKTFYQNQIGFLMRSDINWIAAAIFYLLFILGLVVFVILPAVHAESWQKALLLGALFGLICYATYDLTNLAVLKNWPVMMTIVDMIWGMTLSALVSVMTYFGATWVFK